MKRILLSIIAISLFSVFFAFAGGANEGKLYYLPRNVVNNNNVAIELTEQKSLTTIDKTYSNTSTGNLALFRLRDSLNTEHQTGTCPANATITISSLDGWQFVHENNPTVRRDFDLNCFIVEHKNVNRDYDTTVSVQAIGNSTNLQHSGATAKFTTSGSGASKVYELEIPGTAFNRDKLSYYADYIREADICVVIPNDNNDLESGYYETTLVVESTYYYESESSSGFVARLTKSSGTFKLQETVTVRGYVGVDPGESGGTYSFSVNSAADTYTMDLGIRTQNNPYCVANISFSYLDIVGSNPNNSQSSKFAIYVSPTPVYSTNDTYKFIRMNSENQARTNENTIYYDCYLSTSSGYRTMSDCASSGNISFTDTIASISKVSGTNSYKLMPTYANEKISSSGVAGGSNQWKEEWHLNVPVYLKLTSTSLNSTRQSGLYYSYLYVTLVSN